MAGKKGMKLLRRVVWSEERKREVAAVVVQICLVEDLERATARALFRRAQEMLNLPYAEFRNIQSFSQAKWIAGPLAEYGLAISEDGVRIVKQPQTEVRVEETEAQPSNVCPAVASEALSEGPVSPILQRLERMERNLEALSDLILEFLAQKQPGESTSSVRPESPVSISSVPPIEDISDAGGSPKNAAEPPPAPGRIKVVVLGVSPKCTSMIQREFRDSSLDLTIMSMEEDVRTAQNLGEADYLLSTPAISHKMAQVAEDRTGRKISIVGGINSIRGRLRLLAEGNRVSRTGAVINRMH